MMVTAFMISSTPKRWPSCDWNTLVNDLSNKADDLSKKHEETTAISDMMKRAHSYAKVVIPAMQAVRLIADKIEPLLGEEYKPFPSYEDLLYSVQ